MLLSWRAEILDVSRTGANGQRPEAFLDPNEIKSLRSGVSDMTTESHGH